MTSLLSVSLRLVARTAHWQSRYSIVPAAKKTLYSKVMATPSVLPNYVYKILPNTSVYQGTPIPVPADWPFPQTEVDAKDGFVHMSTAAQLEGTLNRFFGTDQTVQLLKIDYARLSAFKIVKWEKASDGQLFPHLYATLDGEYVRDLNVVPKESGWGHAVKLLVEQGWIELDE
ncbi:hypothetical protein BD410DRAFT_760858 [Rickenella mellea]|uniref:DUF952-domain-containing protein n=1 Tax=Rickenella mellea TaxID=50990 RepID=A0A4Y7QJA6_9AGAM|nr:hypothetical protein BD410DRAFT_760858 [Rickenella mellea]